MPLAKPLGLVSLLLRDPSSYQPVRVDMNSPVLPNTNDSPPNGLKPTEHQAGDAEAQGNTFTSAPIVADTFTVMSFIPHWPEIS